MMDAVNEDLHFLKKSQYCKYLYLEKKNLRANVSDIKLYTCV